MSVEIPFKEPFRDSMLAGTKQCTSRTRRYGHVGDTFSAFGADFVLTNIVKLPLADVASMLHRQEGFSSQEAFIELWAKIHPRKGWVPQQQVWVHWFRKVEDTTPTR